MRFHCCVVSGLLLALALLVTGCGGPVRLHTKGKIVKGGAPWTLPAGDMARVFFVPVLKEGENPSDFYAAAFNIADGTFKVTGKDGTGMPPGKYRIMIEHLHNRGDAFKGAYNAVDSPFVFEVNTTSDEVVIDLDKAKS